MKLRSVAVKKRVAVLTLLAASVVGRGAFAADTWSADVTIDQIEGNTNTSVYFVGSIPNPAGCSQANTVSWALSDPAAKNFMAMMLTAKASNRPVQVLVDGSTCLWAGWPKLLSIKLK